MSLKILAEMQSGKVVQGLTEIQQGLKGVQSAAERSSKALESIEQHQRAMREIADATRQVTAARKAEADASRQSATAARQAAAAVREAERTKRAEIRETSRVTREEAKRASEAQQAAMTLRNTALGVAAGAGAMGATGGAFIKQAVTASSTYEEQTNEFEVFFGENAKAADKWARNLGTSLGKGAASVRTLALSLQANLAPILGSDKAYEYTKKLTQRAIDLGSLRDTDPETVAKNIVSGLQGLPTPMRKYGATPLVGYLQDFQDQRAAKLGQKSKKWKDMNYQERTMLRADYITEKTPHAEGDAERTATSTANTILRAKKAIQDAILELGQAFKDTLKPAITAVADLAEWFNSLSPATKRLIADIVLFGTGLATLVGFIGMAAAAWWAYEAAATAAKVMTGTVGTAGTTGFAGMISTITKLAGVLGPVLLLLGAMALVAGVVADVWGDDLVEVFTEFGTTVMNVFKAILSGLVSMVAGIAGLLLSPITWIMSKLEALLEMGAKAADVLGMTDTSARFREASGIAGAAAETLKPENMARETNRAMVDLLSGQNETFEGIKESLKAGISEGLATTFQSTKRGWEKILNGIYSNETLLPGAQNGKKFGPEEAAAKEARDRAAESRAKAEQAYQDQWGGYGDLGMVMLEAGAMFGDQAAMILASKMAKEGGARGGFAGVETPYIDVAAAAKKAKAAAAKQDDAREKILADEIKAEEAAAAAEEKAAAAAQRHAEKMNRIYSDIISNVLGRFEAFAAGDMKGAFGKLGASLGGLIEQAGVPFAGAIGSALDAVTQALAGPLEKLGGKLFGGAEISDAVDSFTKVMVMAAVAVGVFALQMASVFSPLSFLVTGLSSLLGPIGPLVLIFGGLTMVLGGWLVLLVLLSTQTQEFANFAGMLNEAVKRLIAPMGSFWESLYPLGGALMQIGTILGPVGEAFLGLLNAPSFIQPLIDVAVFAAKALLVFSYLMYGTAAAWQVVRTTASSLATVFDRVGRWFEQIWLGMIQPFQWLGTVIGMAVQGLMDWFMALSWVQAVMNFFAEAWAGMTGILMSGVSAFGKAMIGMINWVEDFTGLNIIGEGALGDLVESIDKAWKDLDKVSAESGKKEADKFLEDQNAAAAGSTEQNINLPEAFKLAAARATATDANGNGSWGSGAGSGGMARGDMPIERFNPTVNITVLVNGVTQESAMEYADKSRGFRSLIESGIVMARPDYSLDPGKGRRNRN